MLSLVRNSMDGAAASSSIRKDKEDIDEFLGVLEANFKGRKCYVGQYRSPTTGSGLCLP